MQQRPDPIYFTQAGLDAIRQELTLKETNRPKILERLQAAREMGDLSENGAYKAARFELSDCDRRLRYLKRLDFLGQVFTPSQNQTIEFGHTVTLKTPAGNKTFQLVNRYESNPQKQKLSVESPLGQLLLNRRQGDTVTLKSDAGVTDYTVVKIDSP